MKTIDITEPTLVTILHPGFKGRLGIFFFPNGTVSAPFNNRTVGRAIVDAAVSEGLFASKEVEAAKQEVERITSYEKGLVKLCVNCGNHAEFSVEGKESNSFASREAGRREVARFREEHGAEVLTDALSDQLMDELTVLQLPETDDDARISIPRITVIGTFKKSDDTEPPVGGKSGQA